MRQYRGLKVYVAGPLHGSGTIEENIALAGRVGRALHDAGFVPFVPHTNHPWMAGMPEEDALAYDYAWLDACDILVRLPGRSPGSDAEVDRALAQQKVVVTGAFGAGRIERQVWEIVRGVLNPDRGCA